MSERLAVAAFDFDGTLTRRDTVLPFIGRVRGWPRFLGGMIVYGGSVLRAVARRDRDEMRRLATRVAFRNVAPGRLDAAVAETARAIIANELRSDTVARLQWHLAEGHEVVIVSASYELYVHVVAAHLGAHAVLATRLERFEDGRCTGGLHGRNCRGAEKLDRLDEWLADRGLNRDSIVLWAYGDSRGDRELLAVADHPVWAAEPIASVAPSA